MKIKKTAKSMSHKIAKTAGKTAHAVSKVATSNVTLGSVIIGGSLAAIATTCAFSSGYAVGAVSGAFGGHYGVDD